MLPGATLPASLAALLGTLRPCFTAPSFATFCGLAAGQSESRQKAADLAGRRYGNHYILRAAESRRRSHLFGNGDRGA